MPTRLLRKPIQSILILRRVVMTIPIRLTHHQAQPSQEEEGSLLQVDTVLLRRAARTKGIALIVIAYEVVHGDAGLPGDDAGVGILHRGDTAILVDLEERFPLDAFYCVVAEFPESDLVEEREDFEGDLVGIRARGVSVQG
jgi:hypothetical protein